MTEHEQEVQIHVAVKVDRGSSVSTFDIDVNLPCGDGGVIVGDPPATPPILPPPDDPPVIIDPPVLPPTVPQIPGLKFQGFHFSGAEGGSKPGWHGWDYIYPNGTSSYTTPTDMAALGFNIFRLSFSGIRILRTRAGELDVAELTRLKDTVAHYTSLGVHTLLDLHDYGSVGAQKLNVPDGSTTGTAQSGTADTIVLGSGKNEYSYLAGWFNGLTITLGDGQTRVITAYTGVNVDGPDDNANRGRNGEDRKVTVDSPWDTVPDAMTTYTIVGGGATSADFAHLWNLLATEFLDNPLVQFDLMNEPAGMSADQWYPALQAAIDEIRDVVGATNVIHAEGIGFSSAKSWTANGNGDAALAITGDNIIWHAHQYFDSNSSGGSGTAVPVATVLARIAVFTDWLKANGKKGFIGEFGCANNPGARDATRAFLAHLVENKDVYEGYTAFAMGPWWPANYHFRLEPTDGVQAPQLEDLLVYATI